MREFGFPEEQDLSSPSLAVSQRRPSSEPSVASTTYTHHKKASSLPAIYAFAGLYTIKRTGNVTVVSGMNESIEHRVPDQYLF